MDCSQVVGVNYHDRFTDLWSNARTNHMLSLTNPFTRRMMKFNRVTSVWRFLFASSKIWKSFVIIQTRLGKRRKKTWQSSTQLDNTKKYENAWPNVDNNNTSKENDRLLILLPTKGDTTHIFVYYIWYIPSWRDFGSTAFTSHYISMTWLHFYLYIYTTDKLKGGGLET